MPTTRRNLRLILDESAKAARICPVSQEIVANAFEIRRRVVREVMTPRGEVVYLDTGISFRDNLQRAKAARHTRFPLCAEHFDRTIGLVHIKDMLSITLNSFLLRSAAAIESRHGRRH